MIAHHFLFSKKNKSILYIITYYIEGIFLCYHNLDNDKNYYHALLLLRLTYGFFFFSLI